MLTLGIKRLAFQPLATKLAWSQALLRRGSEGVEAWRLGCWAAEAQESAVLQTLVSEAGLAPAVILTGPWGAERLVEAHQAGLRVLVTGLRWVHGPTVPLAPASEAGGLGLLHPLLPWLDYDLAGYLGAPDRSSSPDLDEAAVLARLQELGYA